MSLIITGLACFKAVFLNGIPDTDLCGLIRIHAAAVIDLVEFDASLSSPYLSVGIQTDGFAI